MDRATLERLLIDHSLGGLDGDTQALLEAYLENDAQAAAECRQWRQAADVARQALTDAPAAETLAPLNLRRLAGARGFARALNAWRPWASAAAAVLVGVALGWAFFGGRPSSVPRPDEPARLATNRPAAPQEEGSFWSVRRLAMQAQNEVQPQASSAIWTSPVQYPRVRGEE